MIVFIDCVEKDYTGVSAFPCVMCYFFEEFMFRAVMPCSCFLHEFVCDSYAEVEVCYYSVLVFAGYEFFYVWVIGV